ncbi:DNA-binding transcriptional regulator, LysR family [Arboricoccus pini]|uniref:DNA-binding transcriptional regulator, LysR family n=1 Tax=Arboricoccus pini TaxID=1963835 RepID=A0A212R8F6_9PROT|nr:LysR family transcriptional regulator [Arboricoccus pini]SNB68475.1 DNA-binding transcriptional regulator, LysR family [Arboricoccus pini]
MPRRPDRLGELEVFIATVEAGSIAAGGRTLGIVPSAASRTIARLERRLGVQLLRRSTRRFSLTDEGCSFHARACAILADLETAEREAASAAEPTGRVRISSSASYVAHVLCRILPSFAQRYPAIAIDIVQQDAVVDLVKEPIDIAIRAGPMADADLIARSLGETRIIEVAAPDWLARYDEPGVATPSIGFTYPRKSDPWQSSDGGGKQRFRISDGEGVRLLALAGLGPARVAEFTVRHDLSAGRLAEIRTGSTGAREPFHAVFVGPARILPVRVRVLLDHLAEHGRVS